MSPVDVPPTPQPTGRNGRAPLGTVTHSPHQLRKGGNRPGTALARPLSLGDPNQHPLPPQTRYLPTPIPPLDNCSKFSAKSDSRSPANPGVLHAAFAVRAPGCRVPCWPMLPPSNGSGTRPNSSDNSMSCKKTKVLPAFFPLQRRTAATSVACFSLGSTTLRLKKNQALSHSVLG